MQIDTNQNKFMREAKERSTEFLREVESIRADSQLSHEGKRDRIAKAWWAVTKALRVLEERDSVDSSAERDELHRKVFAPKGLATGAVLINRRDAADRATRLKDEDEAAQLIDAARLTGDADLAQAVALVAYERRWTSVLDYWADGDSSLVEKINELFQLDADTTGTRSIVASMARGMVYNVVRPRELDMSTDAQIAQAIGISVSELSNPSGKQQPKIVNPIGRTADEMFWSL